MKWSSLQQLAIISLTTVLPKYHLKSSKLEFIYNRSFRRIDLLKLNPNKISIMTLEIHLQI